MAGARHAVSSPAQALGTNPRGCTGGRGIGWEREHHGRQYWTSRLTSPPICLPCEPLPLPEPLPPPPCEPEGWPPCEDPPLPPACYHQQNTAQPKTAATCYTSLCSVCHNLGGSVRTDSAAWLKLAAMFSNQECRTGKRKDAGCDRSGRRRSAGRSRYLAVLVAEHGLVGDAALVLLAGHSTSPHLAQLAAARHGAVVVLALLRMHLQQHPHAPAPSHPQNTCSAAATGIEQPHLEPHNRSSYHREAPRHSAANNKLAYTGAVLGPVHL